MIVGKRTCVAFLLWALGTVPLEVRAQTFVAQGSWNSSDGQLSGTWKAGFDAVGSDLSGAFTIDGMLGFTRGNVSGTLHAGVMDFGVAYNEREVAVFDGVVTGATVSGTFTMPDGVSGQWVGSVGTAAPTAPPTSGPPSTPPPATP